MLMADFATYRNFTSADAAADLIGLLDQHGIPYEAGDSKAVFDPTFAFNAAGRYELRLQPVDFERVRALESEAAAANLDEVDPAHYLLAFPDDELFDVVAKPDEWSSYDVNLAGHLLRERGHLLTPASLEQLRQERNQVLARPEKNQKNWVLTGYLLALFGGLLSVFIGWHLRTYKKTLPTGEQVYAYQAEDRAHGRRIFWLGLTFLALWLLIRFLPAWRGAVAQ